MKYVKISQTLLSELRYNIRLRHRLRKHAFKTSNEIDKIRYKTRRNRVNNMKKYAKENYNNNLETIVSSKNNGNKTFWQVMGRFMGKTNNSTIIPPLRLSDNNYAFTNKEKAECLNDFFYSISSIDDSANDLPNF